ncbi:hypothetical protein EYC80_005337 [Monilinia laxa]|uniref:Uncharacterized protein n=1 Tax=Monilinia laxa TaxID=61186 RepID=A0A5N6KJW8_MONLA|nr:hypothetical protein EYC80_005337 [Monilinia laxa]
MPFLPIQVYKAPPHLVGSCQYQYQYQYQSSFLILFTGSGCFRIIFSHPYPYLLDGDDDVTFFEHYTRIVIFS